MAIGYGNVNPAPAYTYTDELSHKEILFSTAGLTQIGVTLTQDQGILEAGTAMGVVTATGKYSAYSDAASNGLQVCRGILRDKVDTAGTSYLGNLVVAGMLVASKVIGADANAIIDLNARKDTTLDIFQF